MIFQNVAEAFALLGCHASYVVVVHRSSMTDYRSHFWNEAALTTGQVGCLEISANSNQPTLRNITEDRRPQSHK